VDWLGFGGSSRPSNHGLHHQWWPALPFAQETTEDAQKRRQEAAANFFVDSLEAWRQQQGSLETMTLAGHSLGGYLAARYAMKHPERIDGLVLASPAGLVVPPTEDPQASAGGGTEAPVPLWARLIQTAWGGNVTPGQLFRAWSYIGQGGPAAVLGILRRRFGDRWDEKETGLLADYLYHLTAQEGSGEYVMNPLMV